MIKRAAGIARIDVLDSERSHVGRKLEHRQERRARLFADFDRVPGMILVPVREGDVCDALQECSRATAVIAAIDSVKRVVAGDSASGSRPPAVGYLALRGRAQHGRAPLAAPRCRGLV